MSANNADEWTERLRAIVAHQVFFVCGCQKSGTTWIQRLLNAHPEVCCDGEAHLFDLLLPHLAQAFKQYNQRQEKRKVSGLDVIFSDEDLIRAFQCSAWLLFDRFLQRSGSAATTRAIGDKTPENAMYVRELATVFPAAKFIHVIRDGRDGAVSGWAHLKRIGQVAEHGSVDGRFPTFAHYARYFARNHWVGYIQAARRAGAQLGDRYLEVRYETLHAQPHEQTARMLRLLGVDDDAQTVARAVEASSFAALSGGRQRGQTNEQSFFRKGVVGDWQSHFDDEAIEAFEQEAGGLLRDLGYEQAVRA